jgi:putative ABC transport system substrate-binding protein
MPVAVGAQQRGELRRIGLLIPVSEANAAANVEAFRGGLRDLGDVEDVNVAFEYRYADGKDNLLSRFAAELVQAGVRAWRGQAVTLLG